MTRVTHYPHKAYRSAAPSALVAAALACSHVGKPHDNNQSVHLRPTELKLAPPPVVPETSAAQPGFKVTAGTLIRLAPPVAPEPSAAQPGFKVTAGTLIKRAPPPVVAEPPASPPGFRVTAGTLNVLANGRLAIVTDTVRAHYDGASWCGAAQLNINYRGPTPTATPLASGELRQQIGLKLRSQDTCNVVYVMWHISPKQGIEVSVKSNPDMHEHYQCRDHGYSFLRPSWKSAQEQTLRVGTWRKLLARIRGNKLSVSIDGHLAWRGVLPAQAFEFDGPVGLRSDNGQFDVEFVACPPDKRTL